MSTNYSTFIVIAILLLVLAILVVGKVRYTHIRVAKATRDCSTTTACSSRLLAAGRHVHWGRRLHAQHVDLRKPRLLFAGQDVLTADSVGLKLSLLVTYQVADPVKAAHEYAELAQRPLQRRPTRLAVGRGRGCRRSAAHVSVSTSARNLLARVQPEAAKIGISVLAVEVKDVMFPADLKRAFAEVLKAKQEGQAALERARGESAALRNLANAARVLEGNPALMNLRLMQSLSAAQNAGNTLVLGVPGFVPLKNGQQPNREESDAAS